MTELRITVQNDSGTGGTYLTPVYFGFHDGSFDLFDAGTAASAGLEQLAEDGAAAGLAAERLDADPDSQGTVVTGAAGPVATNETTSALIDIDGGSNGFVSLAAMVLPSNDAFIGTDDAVQLFDADGAFLGAQTLTFAGSDVYDAGTEVNTERDAAFINQTAPDTGIDENGVITSHPGFNGSAGNPEGEGEQIILGGTNAFGEAITDAADFTVEGAQIATVHINTVARHTGTGGRDVVQGRDDDDLVDAGGGNDIILTRAGWDVIDAGAGRDMVRAGAGNDIIAGGADNDRLFGGAGEDSFVFATGDGRDRIIDFEEGDRIVLAVEGVDGFADVLARAVETRGGVSLDFGAGDGIMLRGESLGSLGAEDFLFA